MRLNSVVIWSLRAKQAKTPSEDFSRGLTAYWQLTFTAAYSVLIEKVCIFLSCLAVKTTKGHMENPSSMALTPFEEGDHPYTDAPESQSTINLERDQPELRKRYQRIFKLVSSPGFVPPIIATVMARSYYINAETDSSKVSPTQTLR
jgi:hypothetical protein